MINRKRLKRQKKRDRARARSATLVAAARSSGLKILSALDQHLDSLFEQAENSKRLNHT